MPSPNNVLTADSYVQDGLVFQLDGIEYGGIDGQWRDRVRQISFSGNPVHLNQNCYAFDGTANHVLQSDIILPLLGNGGLDLVYYAENTTNAGFILVSGGGIGGYRCNVNGIYKFNKNGMNVQSLGKKRILSISDNKGVGNGISLTANTSFNVDGAKKSTLGAFYYNSFRAFFKGRIYAIRVYSRQLSDREILINQKIDNARFELGLNIPDEVLPATRSLSLSEPFELPDESMTEQDITNENSDER